MAADREQLIRIRAYEIWEQEGRPDGRELEHWARAEGEIGEISPEDSWQGDPTGLTPNGGISPAQNDQSR
jgi:hypothetical protein